MEWVGVVCLGLVLGHVLPLRHHHIDTSLPSLAGLDLEETSSRGFIGLQQGVIDPRLKHSQLSAHSFVAFLSPQQAMELATHENVSWLGYLEPKHKVLNFPNQIGYQPFINEDQRNDLNENPQRILVQFFQDGSVEQRLKLISDTVWKQGKIDVRVDSASSRRFIVEATSGLVSHLQQAASALADLSDVLYVEASYEQLSFNGFSRPILVGSSILEIRDVFGKKRALTGKGQVIGFSDTGLDMNHCAFAERDPKAKATNIVQSYSSNENEIKASFKKGNLSRRKVIQYIKFRDDRDKAGHGSHVVGTASGSYQGFNDGIAPEAQIAFFDIESEISFGAPADLRPMFLYAKAAGASVHSNSWGFSIDTSYNTQSADVDQFMWENDDMLVIFAAGNFGACGGPTTIRAPSTCKSCLSVGSVMQGVDAWIKSAESQEESLIMTNASHLFQNSQTFNHIAYFSGTGPTTDGRRKPEVVAPGQPITSVKKETKCDFKEMSGTSMSTPQIAGLVALIRQYLTETDLMRFRVVSNPSGSLLKAMVLHSARPVSGQRIVCNKLSFNQNLRLNSECSSQIKTRRVNANDQGWGLPNLSNVLYFPRESPFLLHVWDRHEINGTSEKVFPICVQGGSTISITLVWSDAPSSPLSKGALVNNLDLFLQSSSGITLNSSKSTVDPVEQVSLSVESSTTLQIIVRGTSVPLGSQKFSLVATGEFIPKTCVSISGSHVDTWILSSSPRRRINGIMYSSAFAELIAARDFFLDIKHDLVVWAAGDIVMSHSSSLGPVISHADLYLTNTVLEERHRTTECFSKDLVSSFYAISKADVTLDSSVLSRGVAAAESIMGMVNGDGRSCARVQGSIQGELASILSEQSKMLPKQFSQYLSKEYGWRSHQVVSICSTCPEGKVSLENSILRIRSEDVDSRIQEAVVFLLEVDFSMLSEAKEIIVDSVLQSRWKECDSNLNIVFNVRGSLQNPSRLTFPPVHFSECVHQAIIWNLIEITSTMITHSDMGGIILAPDSDVVVSNARLSFVRIYAKTCTVMDSALNLSSD